jgi:hypothetical protein
MLDGLLMYNDIITAGNGTMSLAGRTGRKSGIGIGSGSTTDASTFFAFFRLSLFAIESSNFR